MRRPTIITSIAAGALAFSAPLLEAKSSQRMHTSLAAAVAPAVAAAVLASTALPALAGDRDLGEAVFGQNCAPCHRGGRNIIVPEKTLQLEALEEYLLGGANEEAVVKQVSNGKNAMPAFGGRLSDDDIANVAAYVISTAKAGWP